MADVQSSRRAAAFLARRLELLPASTRCAPLDGRRARQGVRRAIWPAELAARSRAEALDAHRRGAPAAPRVGGADGAPLRVRPRQAARGAARRLPPEEPSAWPPPAAPREHLEAKRSTGERVFELALPLRRRRRRRPRAALRARAPASGARAQHALEVAERSYRIAERGARAPGRASRQQVAEGLGDISMLRGRYEEADARSSKRRGSARGRSRDARRDRGQARRARVQARRHARARARRSSARCRCSGGRCRTAPRARPRALRVGRSLVQSLHTPVPARSSLARRSPPRKRRRAAARSGSTAASRTPTGSSAAAFRASGRTSAR